MSTWQRWGSSRDSLCANGLIAAGNGGSFYASLSLHGGIRIDEHVINAADGRAVILGKFTDRGRVIWYKQWDLGADPNANVDVRQIAANRSGDIAVLLRFPPNAPHPRLDFGCHAVDFYERGNAIVRFDASGACVGFQWFPNDNGPQPTKLGIADDGSVFVRASPVAGASKRDSLIRYDRLGRTTWVQSDSHGDWVDFAVSADGHVALVRSADFGLTTLVENHAADWTTLWTRTIHGGASAVHVAADRDGGVIVAGAAPFDLDLGIGWFHADGVKNQQFRDAFVARFRPDGQEWFHHWSADASVGFRSIAAGPHGAVSLYASFRGEVRMDGSYLDSSSNMRDMVVSIAAGGQVVRYATIAESRGDQPLGHELVVTSDDCSKVLIAAYRGALNERFDRIYVADVARSPSKGCALLRLGSANEAAMRTVVHQATLSPSVPPTTFLTGQCPPTMVEIQGGTFMMGSADGAPNETPAHEVALDTFCMDRTEVTVDAYKACVSAEECGEPSTDDARCNWANRTNHPANCVDWEQARVYCRWAGKDLPTEAQWEYAARGGSRKLTYSWGNEPPTRDSACWNRLSQIPATCAVAMFPQGAYGLVDMAGNVEEWIQDWYSIHYVDCPSSRCNGPGAGTHHVLRGGSWASETAELLRGTHRIASRPANHSAVFGFRCAKRPEVIPATDRARGARGGVFR